MDMVAIRKVLSKQKSFKLRKSKFVDCIVVHRLCKDIGLVNLTKFIELLVGHNAFNLFVAICKYLANRQVN